MDLASVAKTVVGVGKELLGDKGVQEFLCGTYADGTPRNISDAVHGEFLSPKQRKNSSKKKKKTKKFKL